MSSSAFVLADVVVPETTTDEPQFAFDQVLIIVTALCNAFSLSLSGYVMWNLMQAFKNAKKKREKAKRKLYVYSMLFVSQQLVVAFFVQLCVQDPANAGYYDLGMEIYSLFAIYFFFQQWKEDLYLYVDCTWLEPLRKRKQMVEDPTRFGRGELELLNLQLAEERERNRTMTSVRVQQIQDEAQALLDEEQQLKTHQTELFKILIYKSKEVSLAPCKCATIRFEQQKFEKAYRFDFILRFVILTTFFFEVLFTGIDLVVTEMVRAQDGEASSGLSLIHI